MRSHRDPMQVFLEKKMGEFGYTNEDAGREWLGIQREAFRLRRVKSGFTVPELRKIFRETNASDEEILAIFKK